MKLQFNQISQISVKIKIQIRVYMNHKKVKKSKLNLKENVHYAEKKYIMKKIVINIIKN